MGLELRFNVYENNSYWKVEKNLQMKTEKTKGVLRLTYFVWKNLINVIKFIISRHCHDIFYLNSFE